MGIRKRLIEYDPGAEGLNWLVTRVSKGSRRFETNPRATVAERQIGRMGEPQPCSQIETGARSYSGFAGDMSPGEYGGEVYPGARRAGTADGADGDRFLARWSSDAQLVAHSQAVCVSDRYSCRPRAGASREVGAGSLGADFRDRDGLDPMADALDVQSDLVPHRDPGNRRHLYVGGAGRSVRRQVGLRTRLADGGDRGHLILLNASPDCGVCRAVPECDLFANHKARHAFYGYVGRAWGHRDYRTVRHGLPHRRVIAGRRTDA